jgi:AcrR family transcriptional regulator
MREPLRRTGRSQRTRSALCAAALQLVLEKGVEQVTVRDISERAGIDRSTFYLHFNDKRAVLEASQRQLMDELVAHGGPRDTVGARVLAAFRHMAEHAVAYRVLLASADPEVDRRLHAYLAEHVTRVYHEHVRVAGTAPPPGDLQVELFAQYVAGGLRAMAKWWLEQGMPCSPEEMAEMVLRLLPTGSAAWAPAPSG